MATISSVLQIQDSMTRPLQNIINAMQMTIGAFQDMQRVSENSINTSSIEAARNELNRATIAVSELGNQMNNLHSPRVDVRANIPEVPIQPVIQQPRITEIQPVQVPMRPVWNDTSGVEIFNTTGVERYRQEMQSAQEIMTRLSASQTALSAQANGTTIIPANMLSDITRLNDRVLRLRTSIEQVEGNPIDDLGANRANSSVETLRRQLNEALHSQEQLTQAMSRMDISAANAAYSRLNNTIDSAEVNIRDNLNAQNQFNNSLRAGQSAADGLASKIKGVVAALAGTLAIKSGVEMTDNYINQSARLDLINDKTQTQAELQQKIFDSAQRSRAGFGVTTDSVAKLGLLARDAFKGNDEQIKFAELMNKSFKISGATTLMKESAMYQLVQAMSSGRLQGDEYRAIIENAPMLAQAIADKMAGGDLGKLKELSSEGKISASIIKNSLFSAAENIETKFATLPKTFGDVWTSIKNKAVFNFKETMVKVNKYINSVDGSKVISGIENSIGVLANGVSTLLSLLMSVTSFFTNNWSWITPIIWGLVGAFIAYNIVAGITNGILAVQEFLRWAAAVATAAQTGATFLAIAAQQGLNAALYACPITWIVLLIIVLIAVFYAAVAAVNHFAGTSISATGIIAGVFSTLGAFIYNVVAYIWNVFASFAEFLINVFNNPVYSVQRLFANLAINVLDMCISMTQGFDSFATNLSNAMVDGINGALSAWNGFVDVLNGFGGIGEKLGFDKATMIGYTSSITSSMESAKANINSWVGEAPSDYFTVPKMNMINAGDAYKSGYDFGKGVEEKFDISKLMNPDLGNLTDNAKLANDMANTAANTGAMKDSMNASEEDLKYLRDLAEQEVVNRFTTAEINIGMTNHNNINSEMDLDGMVAHLEQRVYETMNIAAEGDHA